MVTTHMRPGYLSKNGIPYSGNAVLNERFRVIDVHGTDYLILRSIVEDPTYLTETFTLSSQFQREPDGSKWDPTPCRPLWPLSLRTVTGREETERESVNCKSLRCTIVLHRGAKFRDVPEPAVAADVEIC